MKDMIEPGLLGMLETSTKTGKWKVYEEYKIRALSGWRKYQHIGVSID